MIKYFKMINYIILYGIGPRNYTHDLYTSNGILTKIFTRISVSSLFTIMYLCRGANFNHKFNGRYLFRKDSYMFVNNHSL